jgi:hypothetical protein
LVTPIAAPSIIKQVPIETDIFPFNIRSFHYCGQYLPKAIQRKINFVSNFAELRGIDIKKYAIFLTRRINRPNVGLPGTKKYLSNETFVTPA